MNKNLIEYKNMGYKEILKDNIDSIMCKKHNNGNGILVIFNKNNEDDPIYLCMSSDNMCELEKLLSK